ncbi:MAG: twin-arginine translocase subunit TatC [Bacteroidales bacterium]|nr:twin-arginine translocase subunit TatC [Bacteroidales bacterium]MDY6002515.1 twin-arginine translocase subunit TatC [Candidatus Cryptobacteroides sp.]
MAEETENTGSEMSFWDHLDVLRGMLFRSILAVVICSIVVFCFKSFFFDDIIFAPTRSDFFMYKILHMDVEMSLVNLEISSQFFVHIRVAMEVGFILSFPYIIFEIWKFIAPALYKREKKAVSTVFIFSSFLFYLGLAIGYLLIVPISLNFFLNYKVSEVVTNTISLNSYISLFNSTTLSFGIVFEFPAVVIILSALGILYRDTLQKYRRYAIVVISFLAAIITPADPMSMIIAAVPLLLLYEVSVLCCRKRPKETDDELTEAES